MLLEPTSIVAKAWAEIDRFAARDAEERKVALVTGAGPVGLLAALLGVQRGLEVHVLDVVTDGPKPALVRDLGAHYHADGIENLGVHPDVAVECTGVAPSCSARSRSYGRTGSPASPGCRARGGPSRSTSAASTASWCSRTTSCSARSTRTARHWEAAAKALADADRGWLDRLVTRTVPIDDYQRAFRRDETDVKVVLEVNGL